MVIVARVAGEVFRQRQKKGPVILVSEGHPIPLETRALCPVAVILRTAHLAVLVFRMLYYSCIFSHTQAMFFAHCDRTARMLLRVDCDFISK